jgi:2-dehydro-3-deoxyphosphogluconate aldolase/(4S)-4-hydroxy-2-oxoglutarate aldolase
VKVVQLFSDMKIQNNIAEVIKDHKIIPVVTFKSVADIESVLEKLLIQNINCIEITLRTEAALEAIEKFKKVAPEGFKTGVGTVISSNQVEQCKKLEVDFMVSPGATEKLIAAMQDSGIAFIPGVMTASEIISAIEMECQYLKLFPFNIAGGLTALDHYSKVFSQVKFCPTGGLNSQNYPEVLKLTNVFAVGGSWVL